MNRDRQTHKHSGTMADIEYLALDAETCVNKQLEDVVVWNVAACNGDVQRF